MLACTRSKSEASFTSDFTCKFKELAFLLAVDVVVVCNGFCSILLLLHEHFFFMKTNPTKSIGKRKERGWNAGIRESVASLPNPLPLQAHQAFFKHIL